MTATILVSFSCAMQVQAFRKVDGYSYASTMCIGNLRSGTASLSMYFRERRPEFLKQALYYFGIILFFALGAGQAATYRFVTEYNADLGIRRTFDGERAVNVPGKAACMEQVRTDRKGRV